MAVGAGRYNDILDTFTHHMAELGYDGVNFGMVAQELGVSKGTIVHHFGTKDRILAALHESYMTRRLAELDYMFDELADPAERLAAALYSFILYQVEDRDATVAFQREVVRLADQESMAKGAALRRQYFDKVRSIVQDGISAGIFRKVNPFIDSLLMFGSAQWAWTWFNPEGDMSIEDVASSLVDLVLGSLLVDRQRLRMLRSPNGRAARTVRRALQAIASDLEGDKAAS
jgi:TetR/AcrR family transcriptional regulator, cholesterol catabolism regulator